MLSKIKENNKVYTRVTNLPEKYGTQNTNTMVPLEN